MQTLRKFGTLEGPLVFDESEGETPTRLLVLLHGWGADGRDLADLGVPLQHMLPDLALWCPNAPAPCSANPMGRQWFELTDQFFTRPEEALEEMSETAYLIEGAIDALCDEMGLTAQDIILGGFSQGGMMSLHIANQGRLQAAGFASLSGALVGAVEQPEDGPHHILLAHGTKDEVVPFAASREAQSLLEDAGHHVDFLARDELGHGIDMAVLDALGQFAHMVTETS
jgi:phospholipase/carboxylesterase